MRYKYFTFIVVVFLLTRCDSAQDENLQFEKHGRDVPAFSADSAHAQVVKQLDAGPRNPGSEGHKKVKKYLMQQLERYAGPKSVFAQRFKHTGYKDDTLQMANIIAAFNTQSTDRIMLAAHWDTRPRADQDSLNTDAPILGADDGASGVAVLLELARLFSEHPPPIGVDIVLFDGEDYGKEGDMANYFLGSRYWSNEPPVEGYQPRFGILLDMVGGADATFTKELNSLDYAPSLVNEIWTIADQQGYSSLFVNETGARISDDHVVINRIRNIPIIDIINHTKADNGSANFAPYWHTQDDDLDIIDKKTLKAVGEIITELVYNRI